MDLATHFNELSLVNEFMSDSGAITNRAPAVRSTAKREVRRSFPYDICVGICNMEDI